ncbi:hypothetical protein CBL_08047 [Carabus blaptoides fortunei]
MFMVGIELAECTSVCFQSETCTIVKNLSTNSEDVSMSAISAYYVDETISVGVTMTLCSFNSSIGTFIETGNETRCVTGGSAMFHLVLTYVTYPHIVYTSPLIAVIEHHQNSGYGTPNRKSHLSLSDSCYTLLRLAIGKGCLLLHSPDVTCPDERYSQRGTNPVFTTVLVTRVSPPESLFMTMAIQISKKTSPVNSVDRSINSVINTGICPAGAHSHDLDLKQAPKKINFANFGHVEHLQYNF